MIVLLGRRATLVLVLLLGGGCISQSPPPEFRHFRPSLEKPSQVDRLPQPRRLHIARLTAASHLQERMVWRISNVEYAFDDVNRWVAPPQSLTRDALETVLYGWTGFGPPGGNAPSSLQVHVVAFERDSTSAIVELRVTLSSGVDAYPRLHSFRATRPVADDSPAAFASAIGVALRDTALQVARFVSGPPN